MNEVQLALTVAVSAVGGLVGLLSWVARSLVSGALVPRTQHEARMADKDRQIADLTVAAQVSGRQAESLTTIGEQVVTVLNELRALARQNRTRRDIE